MSSPNTKYRALAETKEMNLSDMDITTLVENRITDGESERFVVSKFKGVADLLEEMKKQTDLIKSINNEVRMYLWKAAKYGR